MATVSAITGRVFAVKVILAQATGLAASDLTGKSDPYVTFQVDGQHARSSCRPATCDPTWTPMEHFDFKVSDPEHKQLTVQVLDHDLITHDDLLGSVAIDLKPFIQNVSDDLKKNQVTSAFTLDVPNGFHRQQLHSQIHLLIRLMPLEKADQVLELWENECWSVAKGWHTGEGTIFHHRQQWSSEDGHVSSSHFAEVAPKVPDGFTSPGWSYSIGKGDREGWLYATTFAGPWYSESNAVGMVRRRKWINPCQRISSKADGSPRHIEVTRGFQ